MLSYDFLLTPDKQEELSDLLERVHGLDAIGELDSRMRHIHYDWMAAAERTQTTVRLLSEQLSRFLDDQVWLENRRVMDILRGIESTALTLREHRRFALTSEIDTTAPVLVLPLERPLYTPPERPRLDSGAIAAADDEIDASQLF